MKSLLLKTLIILFLAISAVLSAYIYATPMIAESAKAEEHSVTVDKNCVYSAILNPDCVPFSWQENGEIKGVFKEFADKIFQDAGIKIKWLPVKNRHSYLEIINSGVIDIIVDAKFNPQEAQKRGYDLSPIFISTSISVVQNIDFSGTIERIGVMPQAVAEDKIRKIYGEETSYIVFDSVKCGLEALKNDSCDALFLFAPTVKFMLRDENRFFLKSAIAPDLYVDFRIAVKKDNVGLSTLINTHIADTAPEDIQMLLLKYSVPNSASSEFVDFFHAFPIVIISILSAIILITLGLLLTIVILRNSQFKRLAADRRRISELLKEQMLTLHSIGEGVIVTDNNGIVRSINPVGEKIIGYTAFESIGQHHEKIFKLVSDNFQPIPSPITTALKTRKAVRKDSHIALVSRYGQKRSISAVTSPITHNDTLNGAIVVFRDVTEDVLQREALSNAFSREESLNKSLQDMISINKTLLDNTPAFIFAMDIDNDFRYTSFNKACLTLWGLSEEEALGKNDYDVFGAEMGALSRKSYEKAILSDAMTEEIMPFPSHNNTKRIGHFFRKKLNLSDGRKWLVGVGIDITDFENAKKSAAENAEWLRLTINSITDGVITVDIDGNIISMNKISEKILGLSLQESKGKRIDAVLGVFGFFNNQKIESPTLRALHTGKSFESDTDTALILYGKVRARITYRTAPIFGTDKKILGAVFTFRNITEESELRGRIQRAMLQDSMLNAVLSTIPSQVFIKDALDDFKYKVANKNFLEYYKLKRDDVIDHNDFEFFEPEVATQLRNHDMEVCATPGKSFRFDEDISFMRKRKEIFKSVKICFETADKHPYLLGLCFDITDISNMQSRLQNALVAAENAAKAKNYFFASMSHEIRTPLNVVIGLAELLGDENISRENQKEYLTDITVAGNQLLALINDILDLSKLEANQMVFTNSETDFAKIAVAVCSVFKKSLRENSIAIRYEIPDDIPLLYIDKIRLRQILFNLIGNAVKFTQNGTITVSAKFSPKDDSEGTLSFEVRDTGIGISPQDQKNLFLPFVQANEMRGTKTAANGTGLGLSIVKKMLDNMHGSITVKSRLGEGAAFKIEIESIKYGSKSRAQTSAAPESAIECRLNCRVLAVDDVKMNLKVIRALLEHLGCEVDTASSAKEALEILDKKEVEFVLTDVWMPEMNGPDLAKIIRANPKYSKIVVAAVSADAANDYKFDIDIFDDVMTKPITLEKLREFFKKYGKNCDA